MANTKRKKICAMSIRNHYLCTMKKFFHTKLIVFRLKRNLTQAKMAQMLIMDNRSYVDLDQGKSGCSALTFALFLIYCCDDPQKFLAELKAAFESQINLAA